MPDAEAGRRRPSSRPGFGLGMALALGGCCLGAGLYRTKPNAAGPGLSRRRVTFGELSPTSGGGDAPALKVVATLDLPFSPRALTLVRGGSRLVVADAYGGRIAVVDPVRGSLQAVRALPAHNIGGLAA